MDYRIGDVARMLGISADLLRYYEKKGVVHPRKGQKNNYRYYEARDIDLLLECLWFKPFDFSLDEIARLVSDCDYEELSSALTAKETDLKQMIYLQQLKLERLQAHLLEMRRGLDMLDRCEIAMSPEVMCFMNRRNLDYAEDPARIFLTQEWLKYMPLIRRCFEILPEDLPGRGGEGNVTWGLAIGPDENREFPLTIREPVRQLSPEKCIHSVFKSPGTDLFSPELLRYIMNYAAEHDLTVCGGAYGQLIFTVREGDSPAGYYEVWIPIE